MSERPMHLTTYTGRRVVIQDLRSDDVCLADIAHALAQTCRFGGHCGRYYSVAEHSVLVSRLVPPALAGHALLHDAAEAYTGDLVTPLKSALRRETRWWDYLETSVDLAVYAYFGLHRLEAADRAHVKHADLVALATERRDLLPDDGSEWEILRGIEPSSREIRALGPVAAEVAFLRRADRLSLYGTLRLADGAVETTP